MNYAPLFTILAVILASPLTWTSFAAEDDASNANCAGLMISRTTQRVADSIGTDPFVLGLALFGALPGWHLQNASIHDRVPPAVAKALADHLIAQSSLDPSAWQRGIAELYLAIRKYPDDVLNDTAGTQGLDEGLWESVARNLELNQWPNIPESDDPVEQIMATESDRARLVKESKQILQGLGFLSLSQYSKLPAVDLKLKAQFISQIVIGRFGTRPWNAAGKLVMKAIPAHERAQVLELLKQPPAQDHGFVPEFDEISGEWGMREPDTGLIWFNASVARLNWEEAKAYCRHKKQFLPTLDQWARAGRHRILEVFPELRTQVRTYQGPYYREFWTSSPDEDNSTYVYTNRGGDTSVIVDPTGRDEYTFARCVSATPNTK